MARKTSSVKPGMGSDIGYSGDQLEQHSLPATLHAGVKAVPSPHRKVENVQHPSRLGKGHGTQGKND